jgi:hypothetical protein
MLQANKEKSTLRKLFKRKNRSSKIPESASADLESMLHKEHAVAEESSRTSDAAKSHESTPLATPAHESPIESNRTSEVPVVENKEPTYDPFASERPSPDEAKDAAEAKREFARFDQGPLADQPAFIPEDDDDDDATPPPIARHPMSRESSGSRAAPEEPVETLSQSAGPGVQDRWAQIRKNAAQRAATRQRDELPRPTKTGGDDDDTSVEESEFYTWNARWASY